MTFGTFISMANGMPGRQMQAQVSRQSMSAKIVFLSFLISVTIFVSPCQGAATGSIITTTDDCPTSQYDYLTNEHPADFWFFVGTPIPLQCRDKVTLSKMATYGLRICGVTSAPACTLAIAPYATKTDACKGTSSVPGCQRSLRVFHRDFDKDCDYVVVCELFDRPANATGVIGVPAVSPTVHLNQDLCNGTNYEYLSNKAPADTWVFTGTPDTYCNDPYVLRSIQSLNVCGVTGVVACTSAIAPYGSKTEACAASGISTCKDAPRVFFQHFDMECNFLVVCEYFDGRATGIGTGTNGSSPAVVGSAPAPAPPLLPPSPSLLPKAGDVVVRSAYAIGVVQFFCNKVSGLFSDTNTVAELYSGPLGGPSLGNFVSSNGTQVFSFASGGIVRIFANATGASYAQNPNALLDGGYGSMNQSYSSAVGTAPLANVTTVAFTGTVGGVLPSKAVCTKVPGALISYPPWSVPFEANITFYSSFAAPV